MNAVIDDDTQEDSEYISHEEIVEITRDLINRHIEAYRALANA